MGERYKTFYELIKNTASYKFMLKYYLTTGFFNKYKNIKAYQDICQIYLDEYQEDRNLFIENRFLRRQ